MLGANKMVVLFISFISDKRKIIRELKKFKIKIE